MCTPVGHSLLGAAVGFTRDTRFYKKAGFWIFVLFFANLPDMDYLFGIFSGNPNLYHRYWMHSLGFVLLCGILVLILSRLFMKRWEVKWSLFSVFLMLSHLLIDYLGKDSSIPSGIQLFWPVSSQFVIAPVTIFREVSKSSSSDGFIQSLFCMYNLWTIIQEFVILGPLVGLAFLVQKYRKKRAILAAK